MNNLTQKTFIAFTQLMTGLGIMLFLPAGTFDYWQAWVYIFIIGSAIFLILFYLHQHDPNLLHRRLNRAEKEKKQQWIQMGIYTAYVGVYVFCAFDHRFLWSDVPLLFVWIGQMLVAFGYFIIFLALKENTFAATTVEVVAGQKVVMSGPYAIIRHPMYFGGVVMLLGTPLALGSWWGLMFFILITFMISLRLLDEEQILSQNLSGYKEYCQKVQFHLLPFLW